MIRKEDVSFLAQLVKTLEDAESKMENAYSLGDYDKLGKIRKLIAGINKKISEVLR